MPQQKLMKLSDIVVDAQVRKSYDPKGMEELTASVKAHGILQPLLVMKNGRLLAGHRRRLAALGAKLESVPVIVTDEMLTDSQVKVIQLTENMQRSDLTGFEKWTGCYELMCMNPTWAMKDLAEHLHIDASMVTRLLSPSRCTTAWQEALKAGKGVGISDCYQASQLSEEDQAGLLSLKLSGASRDELARVSRQKRNAPAPAVRLSRVKIAMPAGSSVVVSGSELSMPEVVELLADTLKEARKAAEQYDVKTFQSMMRDKAG